MPDFVFWMLMYFSTGVALVLLLLVGMTAIRHHNEEVEAERAQERRIIERRLDYAKLQRDIEFSGDEAWYK